MAKKNQHYSHNRCSLYIAGCILNGIFILHYTNITDCITIEKDQQIITSYIYYQFKSIY